MEWLHHNGSMFGNLCTTSDIKFYFFFGSFQQICQRLREMAVSESNRPKGVAGEAKAAALGVDAPQEELLEIISQVATDIHGFYVSKSSFDHPQYDPLRLSVIPLQVLFL